MARPIRLQRSKDFEAVLAHGPAVAGRHFLVRARPNNMIQPRLGIIAGRRAIPRAVDRNHCKRIVREVFRAAQSSLAPMDVVVVCREPVPMGAKRGARQELAGLFTAFNKGR